MQAAPGGQGQRVRRPPPPTDFCPGGPATARQDGGSVRGTWAGPWPDPGEHRALPPVPRPVRLLRNAMMTRRIGLVVAWTGVACSVQSVLLLLPGRAKIGFASFYWRTVSRLIGMRVRLIGTPAGRVPRHGMRPVIYVCNHSSWVDVPVLGGRLRACFVAKEEVGSWPVVGTVARLGRTLFVSRQRKATGRERDDMTLRLRGGDDLILFPEGTSSDGSRVLPFHSSFFAAARPNGAGEPCPLADTPLIQPVSVVYDRLAFLPVTRANRPVFSWYGDMDLAPHLLKLARCPGMRATVWLHPVLDPADFPSRKALSQAAWEAIARGTALLRQNRDAGEAVRDA